MKHLITFLIMSIIICSNTVPSYAVIAKKGETTIVDETKISKKSKRKERRKRIKERFKKIGKALYIILGFAALGAVGGMIKLLLFSLMKKILWLSILSGVFGVVFLVLAIVLFAAPFMVISI